MLFSFFFLPIYFLRPSLLSTSSLVVTQVRAHKAVASPPFLLRYVCMPSTLDALRAWGDLFPPHFSCKLPRWCGAVCCCGYTKIFTVVQVPAVKTLLRFQTVNVTKRNGECSIDPTEQRGAAGFRNDRFSVLTATQEVTRPQCSMELTRSRRLKLIPPSFWITRVPKISASIARAVSFCRRM